MVAQSIGSWVKKHTKEETMALIGSTRDCRAIRRSVRGKHSHGERAGRVLVCPVERLLWMAAVEYVAADTDQGGSVAANRSENRSGIASVQISEKRDPRSAGDVVCCLNHRQRLLSSIRSRLTLLDVHSKLFL